MSYMRDLEEKLRQLLGDAEDEKVIKFVKETVLESYRNGQQASNRPKRQGRNKPAGKNYQR